MRGFIEVTYQVGTKYTINVNQIVWVTPSAGAGLKSYLILQGGTTFKAEESYEELVAKIAEATR